MTNVRFAPIATKSVRQRITNRLIDKYGHDRPSRGPKKAMDWLARQPGFEDLDRSTFFRAWRDLGWPLNK